MKGAFTCPYCMTQNACDCEACKPFIKEGEPVNMWDETGGYHICGKCGKSYSPDQSLNAEFKLITGLYVTKPFIVANVREIIDGWEHFDPEGYSFSKMVEMFNEKAADFYNNSQTVEPKTEAVNLLCDIIVRDLFPLINEIGDRNYNNWLRSISLKIESIKL